MSGPSRSVVARQATAAAVPAAAPGRYPGAAGPGAARALAEAGGAIAVTELTGPDGRPLAPVGGPAPTPLLMVNERGQVAGLTPAGDSNAGMVVWHRGTVTPVAPDPGGAVPYVATDLSKRGQVVGIGFGPGVFLSGAFSSRDGAFTLLPTGGRPGQAWAVNDRGQVLGDLGPSACGQPDAALVVWEDGEIAATVVGAAAPRALNGRGQALVQMLEGDTVTAVWQVGGDLRELGTLGGRWSEGAVIDERGRVVGTSETAGGEEHAFLWRHGRMVDLGTLGGRWSAGVAAGDRGWVVGTSETAGGEEHAFLWRHGRMVDLGTLGGASSRAHAVDGQGRVVGTSGTAGGEEHAFLWRHGRMVDLGRLAGGGRSQAVDINDRGQIVGAVDGRAVMWTVAPPLPPPLPNRPAR